MNEFTKGWRTLAASFLGIATGVSSLYFYSLGIFIKPMASEFGWSRGQASLGALVGTACAAVMSIPMGRLVDRFGSARVALASVASLGLGFAALGGLAHDLASFLVISAIASLLSAASSPLPYSRLIVAHFSRWRGLALGIAIAATGIGAILIPQSLAPYVAAHGWRAGYFALAIVVAVALPLLAWLLTGVDDRAGRNGRAADVGVAALARDPAARLLAAIFFLAATAVLGTVVQFVPMLGDAGLSIAVAGRIAGLIGVAAIGGRLATGWLLDRAPPHRVTAAVFVAGSAGAVVLALGGRAAAVPGALIVGLAVGAEVDLIAFLVGRHFRRDRYGSAYGAVYAAFLIGGAAGPGIAGYLQQASASYGPWLWLAAALLLTAAALALRIDGLAPAGTREERSIGPGAEPVFP